jgi:hypothetical protein
MSGAEGQQGEIKKVQRAVRHTVLGANLSSKNLLWISVPLGLSIMGAILKRRCSTFVVSFVSLEAKSGLNPSYSKPFPLIAARFIARKRQDLTCAGKRL